MHCHILPGIDDGAWDEETSHEMLRLEAHEGVGTIIFTPHYKPGHHNASPRTVRGLTEELQDFSDREGLGLHLYPGNEILYSDEVPDLLAAENMLTLADSSHVLIEFFPTDPYERIRGGLYEVLAAGYKPVLAHVERCAEIVKHPERAGELADMGVRLQVNASSVMGRHGLGIRGFTKRLLKQDLVSFIASDAHDTGHRSPNLKKCAAYVSGKYGDRYAEKIFRDNVQELIDEA